MPELRHLRYFLAAADELNFTRAAARLGVSQQVLSTQIRQLEDELGVQLFDRSTHRVALTAAGSALAERGQAAYAAVEALWEDARLRAGGAEGVLRFGFSRSRSYDTTPRLIAEMRAAHPQVEVVGVELASAELPLAARDGRVDIALVHWGEGVRGLFARELRRLPLGVVVRVEDPLAERGHISLAELADRVLLVSPPEVAPGSHAAIVRACADAGFEPRLAAPVVPFDAAFVDVAAGRGVAIAVEAAKVTLPAGLRWVAVDGRSLDLIVTLVWDPGRSCPVRELFLAVAERLQVQEGWDQTPT